MSAIKKREKQADLLQASRNQIEDIAALAELSKLESASLGSNAIANTSAAVLANLSGLITLNIQANPALTDLDFLKDLENLQHLDLQGTSINNLAILASFDQLKSLRINSTNFTDYTPLMGHGLFLCFSRC
ncbi:MAG: hypothetical protein ACOH5I_06790 [Oligoflexus sp.]